MSPLEPKGIRRPPVILVADDDLVMRTTMSGVLRASGYSVIEAVDGKQALDIARAQRPDVILLDLVMPKLDGFAVCEQLRADPATAETPVLVLTGREDNEAIQRAFEIGATDFATKLLSPTLLVHRVRFMLRAVDVMSDLRESESRLANAQRLARLGNWEWDVSTGLVVGSPVAFALMGVEYDPAGRHMNELKQNVAPADLDRVKEVVASAFRGSTTLDFALRLAIPGQRERHVHMLGQAVEHQAGEGTGIRIAGTIQDITERTRAEDRIKSLAYYDALTGLPNRLLLTDQVRVAMAMARRENRKLALLLVDLDNFKSINDTLGHSAGDQVLRAVGARLRDVVRDYDSVARGLVPGEVCPVGRLGGDEFLIAVGDLASGEHASTVAARLLESLREPLVVDSNELFVAASIGISVYPDDGSDFEEIFKNADVALYHAKDNGRNTSEFFSASLNEAAVHRLLIETSLRRSLERNEMTVHYQPQFDVVSGRLLGAEALLRWTHPDVGAVGPSQFIPLAERIGMIGPLTEFVLTRACQQARAWHDQGAVDFRIAVNLSAQLFRQPELQRLSEIPAACGVGAEFVELEITETALLNNPDDAERMLTMLRQRGFRIALDDFGVGYSSLSHLRRFALDSLKIDRSFIRDIVTGARERAIVGALIDLARRLGIEPIAEGIEEIEQRDALIAKGCRVMQGYLIGRPMPADQLTKLIEASRVVPVIAA
ncbi:MAG: EAL domain-containing protein [bacterium]